VDQNITCAQLHRIRGDVHAIAGGVGLHVIGLELEVAGEIPVGAEGPVVLAAAEDAAVVQVQPAVAGQQLHRAVAAGGLDVAEHAARIRVRFAGQGIS
jgi:hypothetical protein